MVILGLVPLFVLFVLTSFLSRRIFLDKLQVRESCLLYYGAFIDWDRIDSYFFDQKVKFDQKVDNLVINIKTNVKLSWLIKLKLLNHHQQWIIQFPSKDLPALDAALVQVIGDKKER